MNIFRGFVFAALLLACITPSANAQKVTGKWYGAGFVDMEQVTNNYLCELLLIQNGNTVTGEFNYYFRNGYFSNKIKGTFTNDSRYLYISLMPIMYNRTVNTINGVDCPMHGEFTLKVARTGSSLSGNFVSDDLHKYACAPLKVTLKKLLDTDPTLKDKLAATKNLDSLLEDEDEVKAPAKVDTPKAVINAPKIDTPKTTAVVTPPVARDTSNVITTPKTTGSIPTQINAIPLSIAADAERKVTLRATTTEKILEVTDDSVRVDVYDNAVLDYDTISVFFNKKLVSYKQLLQVKEPIRFYVHVNDDETKNDLVMYAENLGLIPPNSAIMIITDSGHRYEVSLTSDYQKNAAIRLRKGQKPIPQQ